MTRRYGIAIAVVGLLTAAAVVAQVGLEGDPGNGPQTLTLPNPPDATEQLFRGDLTAEIGLGCSNTAGTSGGPNDWAQGVTATLAPPFGIISTTYNIFTQVSPTITAFSFVAWAGGGSPGAELGRITGLPFSQGNHTQNFNTATAIVVGTPQFFFGFNQPQTDVGMRIGLDTSSGSEGESFIRAPACGAGTFFTVDSLGFPGNWVMAAVIDDTVPVELMTFDVD